MKTLKIYSRTVMEKTGFRKYPYKEVKQVVINYDGKTYSNCTEKVDNPRLKIKFEIELETRNKGVLENYLNNLGRSEADKFTKKTLTEIVA